MKTVFISYSSVDKIFAEKLSNDFKEMGIGVWFDKWEIKVGDSIIENISIGIEKNDYLAIILSPASVNSDWVNKELRTALYKEIEQRSVFVLPILYKDCQIPLFLKEKSYADFRENYDIGLRQVLNVILEGGFESEKNLNEQLADFHIDKAIKFEKEGNIAEALLSYEKAITLCPRYDEAYFELGVLHLQNGNLEEAKVQLNRALEINPNSPKILINLGGLSSMLEEWESAIVYYNRALDGGASSYIVYNMLGRALLNASRFNKAIEVLRKAIELSPNINEYIFICSLLYQAYSSLQSPEGNGYALAYVEEYAIKLEQIGKDNIDLHLHISEQFLNAYMPTQAYEFLKRAMSFNQLSHSGVISMSKKIKNFQSLMGSTININATSVNYEVARKNIIRSLDKMDQVVLYSSDGMDIPIKIQKGNE